MSNDFENTWEMYTSSWKESTFQGKEAILEKCLDTGCEYNDPITTTTGTKELVNYMLEFHKQVPGGHFVTHYFLAHNSQSIAKWEMKNGEDLTIGEGISYGKYNDSGKLIAMTGFFETPGS